MKYKGFWKKIKRATALLLAAALFLNGWSEDAMPVSAAEGELTVKLLDGNDAEYTSAEYTGSEIALPTKFTVKEETTELEETDYSVEWKDSEGENVSGTVTNAGIYTCTVTGEENGSYAGKGGEATFEVTPFSLDDYTVTVDADADLTYTGLEVKPEIVVKKGDDAISDDILSKLSISYTGRVDAGTAKVTVAPAAGDTNVTFNGTELSCTYSITKLNLGECTVSLPPDVTYTYNRSEHKPTVTLTRAGKTVDSSLYTVAYSDNTNAGTAKVTVTPADGNANVEGSNEAVFSIAACGIKETDVTLSSTSSSYTGAVITKPTVTVSANSTTLTEDTDYTVEYDPADDWKAANGTYQVKVVGIGNYSGTVTKTFKIDYDTAVNVLEGITISGAVKVGDIYYFTDKATITANDGYTLVGAIDGKIEISTDESDKLVEVKSTTTRTANGVKIGSFKKDSDKPVPTVTVTYAPSESFNQSEWAKSITSAVLKIEDNISGVDGYQFIKESEKATAGESFTTYSTAVELKDNLTSGMMYSYRAKDKAGNVSEWKDITIYRLDAEKPTIVVKDPNGTVIEDATDDEEKKLYLNEDSLTDGSYKVTVESSDSGSGVKANATRENSYTPNSLTDVETGKIVTTVSDNVGNEVTHTIRVVYDSKEPEISNVLINSESKTEIVTNQAVTISADITDDYLDVVKLCVAGTEDAVGTPEINGNTYTWTIDTDTNTNLQEKYQIHATDKSGNPAKSAELVIEIDKTPPTFTVDLSPTDPDANASTNEWWNTDVTFTVTVENGNDTGSTTVPKAVGYKKIKSGLTEEEINNIVYTWTDVTLNNGKYVFTLPETDDPFVGKYHFCARDDVGNVSDAAVIVFNKDKTKPVITDIQRDDNEEATVNDVTISATVTELYLDMVDLYDVSTNEKLEVSTEYNSEGFKIEKTVTSDENDASIFHCQWTISVNDQTYFKKNFQIRAYDQAGNDAVSAQMQVEIDRVPPTFTVSRDQDINNGWRNEDTIFTVTVENGNDSESTVKPHAVKYRKDNETTYSEWKTVEENNGVYTYTFKEEDTGFKGYYYFIVKDELDNESSEAFALNNQVFLQKDKVAPVTDKIYIEYSSDSELTELEDAYAPEFENGESSNNKLIHTITNAFKRIFAKEYIEVRLYVSDNLSGAASLEYTLNRTDDASWVQLEKNDEYVAQIGDASYSIFSFKLDKDKTDPAWEDRLSIRNITDVAGNVSKEDENTVVKIDSQYILVVDGKQPELNVEYSDNLKTNKVVNESLNKTFVSSGNEKETVKLTFTEAYYAKYVDENNAPVKPVIAVKAWDVTEKSGSDTPDFQSRPDRIVNPGEWKNGQFTVEIDLPYASDGGEVEYQITASYTDGSGNILSWTEEHDFGSIDMNTGVFTTGIIVLDNRAPELTSYSTSAGKTDRFVDGTEVYTNRQNGNADSSQVEFTFEIDDNALYWNPEKLTFKVFNDTTKESLIDFKGTDITTWEDTGRTHNATVTFDGQENVASSYHAEIYYEDETGTRLILSENTAEDTAAGTMKDGTYTSIPFILDLVAPTFEISYNDAYRLIKNGKTAVENDDKGQPKNGYTAYYGGDIEVTFTIEEQYAEPVLEGRSMTGLADYMLSIKKDGTNMKVDALPKVTWSQTNLDDHKVRYTGKFTLTEEADYVISLKYKDIAGNLLIETTNVHGKRSMEDGIYQSESLILDTTAPVINLSYTDTSKSGILAPVNTDSKTGRIYFNENAYLKIDVADKNVRYHELKEELSKFTAMDSSGTAVDTNAKKTISDFDAAKIDTDGFSWEIPLTTDANYTIPVVYEDLAGNKTVCVTQYPTVDKIIPTGADKDAKLTLDYSVSGSGFLDAINYKNLGYLFADSKMTVKVTTEDTISGIWKIRFTLKEDGEQERIVEQVFDPSPKKEHTLNVPLSGSDFKGTVKAEVFDWSTNMLEKSRGHIVESGATHESTGSAVITTLTSPSKTVDGEDFYNSDVKFNLTMKDTYSGINNLEYTVGHAQTVKVDYGSEAGDNLDNEPGKEITYEFSEDMTLSASSNNENGVKVMATYTDNTNHTKMVEQLYNIDATIPIITVEYDLNEPLNEKYYNQTRTATVTIQERNFDENDVEFTITNTDGEMPSIGGWNHGSGESDDTKHTCDIVFSADGDYTFTVAFEDKAGNKAEYDEVDEFTVDQTAPEIQVTWDNNQALHDKYYAEARNATIEVTEHNFNGSEVRTSTTATDRGQGIHQPVNGGFSDNGDVHRATVPFSSDGVYTMEVEYTDLAGNEAEIVTEPEFIIDQTAPEIEIYDIVDRSANNGKVAPSVRYSDTNYDADQVDIELTGVNNGTRMLDGSTSVSGSTVTLNLSDFAHTKENDDLYTLKATVYDMAGNSTDASVMFSVNRFGSVYVFEDATKRFIDRYYSNEEEDIVVTEINVDTLEHREISYGRDGELVNLTEGTDYAVRASGSDASWKSYEYTMYKENFEKEGKYSITIYSEDRAANNMSNKANKVESAPVEFIIDKTSPTVVVTGIENDETYNADSRDVKVSVQDNIAMGEAAVYLDGNEHPEYLFDTEYLEEQAYEPVFALGNAPRWQTVKVTAKDAAGNETALDEIRVLISTNLLIRYMNSPLAIGGSVAAATSLTGVFFSIRKRRIL